MIFSVIVPVYNVDKYLHECINSVINQSYTGYELILVDDGSTDSSSSICDDYSNKYNNIIAIHKTNGGLVSARKAGALKATGDYIICLDGDDMLDTECLKLIKENIDKFKPDVLCFGYVFFNESYKDAKPIRIVEPGFYDKQSIKNKIFPYLLFNENGDKFPHNLCGKAIKRDLYLKYQFKVEDSISMGEDLACSTPIIVNSSSIYVYSNCFYKYRQFSNSMTKRNRPLSWINYEMVFEHCLFSKDLVDFDFTNQFLCLRTKNIFNIAYSQFYGDKHYKIICKELSNVLMDDKYYRIIHDAKFKGLVFNIIKLVLLKKLFFLLYIFSLLKK